MSVIFPVERKSDYFRFKIIFLPLLVGILSAQKITAVGEFYVGELLAIAFLFFHLNRVKYSVFEKMVLFLSFLWAVAQLLSDVLNNNNFADSFKGIFAPVVFSCTILGLAAYFRMNLKRMPSFLLGVSIGAILSVIFFPDLYARGNPWKWGLGAGVATLISIYSSFFWRRERKILLMSIWIVFFIISLMFDARSLASFPLISMLAFGVVRNFNCTNFSKLFGGDWGGARLLFLIVPLVLLVNFLVSLALSSASILANFSDDAAEKYRSQASGTYGLLIGGRSEILISSRAFLDSPFLGHGSWAKDKTGKYIREYNIIQSKLGYFVNDGDVAATLEKELIPVHSYLMGGFVWAGVFGGVFWIYLLNQVVKRFVRCMSKLPYYYYYGVLLLVWNIFFSPFGASARWVSAIFLSSYFVFLFEMLKQNKSK